FDEFVREYNEERIHERLDGLTPAQVYRPSEREFNGLIAPYDYDEAGIVRSVRSNGEIKWCGRLYYVSEILAGEKIVLMPYGDGLWEMYYRFHPLGLMNDHLKQIERHTEWRKINQPGT
ncbi:transposase InsO family protein, partial [Neisseria sp. HSC-16F19]